MHRKLSKKGMLLVGIIALVMCVILVVSLLLFNGEGKKEETKKVEDKVEQVITENQILKVQLLDFVSSKNALDYPESKELTIEAKENVAGVIITNKQTFYKSIQLQAPAEDATPFVQEGKLPSHNAYILVLVGDVVKYQDSNGKEKIVVENARIDYYVQSVLLEEKYNSLYICSIDGTREKMVKVDEYKEAMKQIDTYKNMLQW